jgi:hypothetical protein
MEAELPKQPLALSPCGVKTVQSLWLKVLPYR